MIRKEGKETAITVIRSGKNSTMRHMQRTQYVCAKWLTHIFSRFYDVLFLRHCPSPDMCGDLMTKPVTNASNYDAVKDLIFIDGVKELAVPDWNKLHE